MVFVTHGDPAFVSRGFRYSGDLRQQLEVLGYAYRHEQVGSLEQLRQGARRWYHEGVKGVIFGMFQEVEWLQSVNWSEFSLLFLGGTCPVPFLHTVKGDAAMAMEMTLGRALTSTEERVGVVLHQHRFPVHDDRMREGMARMMLVQLSLRRRVPLLLESLEAPLAVQQRRLKEWLLRYRPGRVVGFHLLDWMLQSVGVFAKKRGSLFVVIQDPPAQGPGAVEPTALQAKQAVQWMDTMIRHREVGVPEHPLHMLVPPEWSDGPE